MIKVKTIGILLLILLAIPAFFIWIPVIGIYVNSKEFTTSMENKK